MFRTAIDNCFRLDYDSTKLKIITPMAIVRFGISLDGALLERFDARIKKKDYANRSEAIRDLIRDNLVSDEWESSKVETVGTITIVYSHDTRELTDTLIDLQHHYYESIVSSLHIHIDEHNCLEVIVVKGKGGEIKAISDKLIGTKGVKHGKLSLTTTGKHLK